MRQQPPDDVIVDADNGACPADHPYCLSEQGVAWTWGLVDDLGAAEQDRDAAREQRDAAAELLHGCQEDLNSRPQYCTCECDQEIVYRVPGYVWVIVGALAATTVAAGTVALVYGLRR